MASDNENISLDGMIGLFFVADNKLLLHICALSDGEYYGDFINYPESHDDVWQREYQRIYIVDFDYFPRGRIVYNRIANIYKIFYDTCADKAAGELYQRYPKGCCEKHLDEHYQCYYCNKRYVV